jgi:predicted nucleic acid-binding protein
MYIVDTMLISYIFRDDPLALPYQAELESNQPLFMSVQTVGELYYGAENKGWGKLFVMPCSFTSLAALILNSRSCTRYFLVSQSYL